eukprot:TRINITY_DN3324_c0_g1_i2.p1 TRINITY_DN3324_c0_g1~~TRINITY_DN3324_c0_g1_i2.p1  ORF type:complete len:337 (-),score=84.79 TRINITY_DN3324_c0_g1_i2:174-1184(-)
MEATNPLCSVFRSMKLHAYSIPTSQRKFVQFRVKACSKGAANENSRKFNRGTSSIDISTWHRREILHLSGSFPMFFMYNIIPSMKSKNGAAVHEMKDVEVQMKTIKDEIRKVISKTKAAGLLRLVFHDAGTFNMAMNEGGMNGSIILELERPTNMGLDKSVKVLGKVKEALDKHIQVSWADLIALAGAEAVSYCGGPSIPVKLGRQDSGSQDPDGQLPSENLTAAGLKDCFSQKGFSVQELVALSGSHTLGNKGFGNPTHFDNSYFRILLEKPWAKASKSMEAMIGLPSDHALVEDEECLRWVKEYANSEDKFFSDFSKAYIKLTNSGAKWKWITT